MKRNIVLLIFCLLTIFSNAANSNFQDNKAKAGKLYTEANICYKNKDYIQASVLYDSILKIPLVSWEIYYNLGNSYFRIGKYTQAILNYERAYKLEPKNKDIEHNISVCQTKIADKTEQLPSFVLFSTWHKFVELFPLSLWAIASLSFFALLFTCLFLYLCGKSYNFRKRSFWAAVLCGILFLTSLFSAISARETSLKTYAIITSVKSEIKESPEFNSKTLYILHEGSKVAIVDSIEPFYKIKISDGNQGWIPIADLEKI